MKQGSQLKKRKKEHRYYNFLDVSKLKKAYSNLPFLLKFSISNFKW